MNFNSRTYYLLSQNIAFHSLSSLCSLWLNFAARIILEFFIRKTVFIGEKRQMPSRVCRPRSARRRNET